MKIKPLGSRVLVKPIKLCPKTPGGIELPDVAQGKPRHGEVLAVGPGKRLADGKLEPLGVTKGQKVIYQQYAGFNAGDPRSLYTKDDDPLILDETDLLAVVDD